MMVLSLLDIGLGLLRRAQIGLRHDLHQRHARAVEIDIGILRMLVVQALARVLLQMQPLDADGDALAAQQIDDDLALADDRALVLADLIALRQVGIEIVLPVEDRSEIDLGLQPEPGADGLGDAVFVDHRQHAGHGGIDQAHMGVRLAAELGRGAGEQLGLEVTCACTSMPITTSQGPVAPSMRLDFRLYPWPSACRASDPRTR